MTNRETMTTGTKSCPGCGKAIGTQLPKCGDCSIITSELEEKSVELAHELLAKAENYAVNGQYARGTKKEKTEYSVISSLKELAESADRIRSTMVSLKYELNTEKSHEILNSLASHRLVMIGAGELLAEMFNITSFTNWFNDDDV